MSRTENFRKQHDEILAIARQINGLLQPAQMEQNAAEVRTLLSHLSGKLSVHLAMEDKSLYPSLIGHTDAHVKSVAKSYSDEMGSLAGGFKAYLDKWSNATVIRADANHFITETKALFNLLSKRIQRENTELYPLLDKMPH